MSEKLHKDLINRIAKNSKKFRELNGYTQEDMRDHGFNYRHYQRIESADTAINTRTLARLASAFKIDPLELIKPIKKN